MKTDPPDRRPGDGPLPRAASSTRTACPSSPAAGRSSATATSPASARRSTPTGDDFPTWRGHNEQGMAHAAIAYAKALNRKRAMAVTTSIGPGALNMVTACALAHVNRLPVLFLPGDVFANRAPRPGAAAARGLQRRHHHRQRRLPAGQPLLRPHHAARAAPDRAAARLRHHDRPGRLRPGHPRLLPGRAGRGLRLAGRVLRAARSGTAAARGPACARSRSPPTRSAAPSGR